LSTGGHTSKGRGGRKGIKGTGVEGMRSREGGMGERGGRKFAIVCPPESWREIDASGLNNMYLRLLTY